MNQIATIKQTINDETLAGETYARILPELQALSVDELIPINVDIPSTVATVLGALPEIRALRPEIQEHLARFDMEAFNKLEDYAFTLHHAQAQYLTATQPSDDLEAVSEEAAKLRETLFVDASALAHRGYVDGNKLKELKGANGYKNLATDLGALAAILRESWSNIQGRTGLEAAELDRADKVGQRLMRVVGLREQGPATVAAATEMRTRAFTLLARTYEQARRAITYVRASLGDVDRIAPSLYGGRRRRGSEAPAAVQPVPSQAAVPPPAASTASASHPNTNNSNHADAETEPFGS